MNTAALFDLDGVIVDTEPQYTRFWTEVGRRLFPDIPDFAQRIKGHTLVQIFDEYLPGDTARQAALTEELVRFEQEMDYPLVPGALRFVRELTAAGIPTAVVTSSNKGKMACLYRARPELPRLFTRIFTAEDAPASKPAPDCYIAAAHRLGFEPEQCFVFEDSISGLKAGMASGATVIGLTTSNTAERIKGLCHRSIRDFQGFDLQELQPLPPEPTEREGGVVTD